MLVFVGITPHSPLLLDSISKDQSKRVSVTIEAMHELERELYATFPETIVLISQHPTMYEKSFSINLSDPYKFDLRTFGEFSFETTLHPDILLIDKLQRDIRCKNIPFTLSSDESLDYASAVPLHFLTEHLKSTKIVPITYCELGAKDHFLFGQALKEMIFESNNRIAVIASGDMSHAHTSTSPAGYMPEGKEFDDKFMEIVTQRNTAGLLGLDDALIQNAYQTIYKPTLILFGLLEHIAVSPHILSYETPFGVGYLVANMSV